MKKVLQKETSPVKTDNYEILAYKETDNIIELKGFDEKGNDYILLSNANIHIVKRLSDNAYFMADEKRIYKTNSSKFYITGFWYNVNSRSLSICGKYLKSNVISVHICRLEDLIKD